MTGLQLINLHKSFGATRAVDGVSFEVAQGEIVALLGPSGCGKSTVLALIAGLETPDQGEILWDGGSLRDVPPHQRGFGLMFQDFALFPHMNVFDNVAFGLRLARLQQGEIAARVEEALDLVGLRGFGGRDVNTLSGGEQQRVALARSLAPHPRLLMLDEPLGSLDRTLRERLVVDLREILRRMRQTAIYVTHDQEEAFSLADRVAVMNAGRIEQMDRPETIYRHPASVFVARFLGMANLLPGRLYLADGGTFVETPIGRLPVAGTHREGEVTVLIRPDEVHLNGEGTCRLDGRVLQRSFRGSTFLTIVDVQEVPLTFEFPSGIDVPREEEPIQLGFEPEEAIQLFPR
jgi:ABC-type Fe3+/spermidine/putrescine transport system ATPase subunit